MSGYSKVYIVQEPLHVVAGEVVSRIPLHKLDEFGEKAYIFDWTELKTDGARDLSEERTAYLYDKARRKLASFGDRDYLVPLGNPGLIAIASIVAAEVNRGFVTLLDWVRREEVYRMFQIDTESQPPRPLARVRNAR
jgi:hypothetical protein